MASRWRRGAISSGIADPFLVTMRVLSRFGGAAGVLVVVAGFDGLGAFLKPTLGQVFCGGAESVIMEPVALDAGGGGGGGSDGGEKGGLVQVCYFCDERGYILH